MPLSWGGNVDEVSSDIGHGVPECWQGIAGPECGVVWLDCGVLRVERVGTVRDHELDDLCASSSMSPGDMGATDGTDRPI